ncbi:MAG: radical SAM protein [Ferrovum sp.]|nr:radical SAM protein [Ferrovum sp.]
MDHHTEQKSQNTQSDAIKGSRVELQLLTTLKCNLKCSYCSLGVGDVLGSQLQVSYDLDQLEQFVDTHLSGKEIYVTFYGGEPTLNVRFISAVMQRFPLFRFQMQTNGTLLDNLPSEILGQLSNILISIDGGEKITDNHRGRGIYRQVLKNMRQVRDRVNGSMTARVTWSDSNTSFSEINELTKNFDYVYFQFVADEKYAGDAAHIRQEVLAQLIAEFFAQNNTVYPVIPLMGIVRNKLFPNRAREMYAGLTQCRASTHLINVMPDGKIFPCPDMMYLPNMQQGDIGENWLHRSSLQPHPDMPCDACEALPWCRRNCMKNLYRAYVQKDDVYRLNVVEPICNLIRFMGMEIDRHAPREWFARLSPPLRRKITDCEIYEYVEVMP